MSVRVEKVDNTQRLELMAVVVGFVMLGFPMRISICF